MRAHDPFMVSGLEGRKAGVETALQMNPSSTHSCRKRLRSSGRGPNALTSDRARVSDASPTKEVAHEEGSQGQGRTRRGFAEALRDGVSAQILRVVAED